MSSQLDQYPILQTKNLRLQKIEVLDGHLIITLMSPSTSPFEGPIVIDIMTEMARVMFQYAVIDRETKTVRKYLGRAGNPDVDDFIIEGV